MGTPMDATEYAEHATECLGCSRCDEYLRRECAAQVTPAEAASRAAEAQAWERQAAADALVALWRGVDLDVRAAVDVECGGLLAALDRFVRAHADGATGSCEVDTEWGVADRDSALTDDEVRGVEAPWGLTVSDRDHGRVLVSRPVIRGPWTVDGGAK